MNTATKTKKTKVEDVMNPVAMLQTERDFRDALLMVSIAVNLFGLSLWIAMQATTTYDTALMQFFFAR